VTITNGYTTLPPLRAALGMAANDTTDDAPLELAIEVASRTIEEHVGRGRKFWQDSAVVARKYFPAASGVLIVDDISTVTGLLVKVDTTDNGTFDTSLTITTDFDVHPVNAAAEVPVEPYTSIRLLDGTLSGFTRLGSGRPSVEVTAKFGWPAVPNAIERACIFQAVSIYKAKDTTFGSFQLAEDGSPMRVPPMHPTARALLEPFIRHDEVNDNV